MRGDSCAVAWDLWGRPAQPANHCETGGEEAVKKSLLLGKEQSQQLYCHCTLLPAWLPLSSTSEQVEIFSDQLGYFFYSIY